MHNDTNTPQQAKVKRVIRKALSHGFSVSVSDGDDGYEVKRSRDFDSIIGAVGEMDMDGLLFHDDAAGKCAGWMLLVWESGGDPDELIADHTANDAMEALARA